MAEGQRCDKIEIIYKILIAVCALYFIYKFEIGTAPRVLIKYPKFRLLGPFNTTHITVEDNYTQLIDINNFTFKINPQPCKGYHAGLLLMIIISSNPNNRDNRMVIRNTWGQNHDSTKVVFLIGEPKDINVANQIKNESLHYGDIVQGNFVDVYRNMTYKHFMGLKWVAHHCPTAKYVLKTDDDVFVNSLEMTHFLARELSPWGAKDLIACPLNENVIAERSPDYKWKVTTVEFAEYMYPTYCGGWAILYSLDVIPRLLKNAQSTPFFWIDDIYITGVIAEKIGVARTSLKSFVWGLEHLTQKERFGLKHVRPFVLGPNELRASSIMEYWTGIRHEVHF